MDADHNISAISNLSLRWKNKRWFSIVIGFNFLIPIILVLDRIIFSKSSDGYSWWILTATPISTIVTGSVLFYYCRCSNKFRKDYQEIIKPERQRYYHWGLFVSCFIFCIFTVYLVMNFVNKIESNESSWVKIFSYVFLGLSIVMGTISTAFLTFYEFCIAFDIFYNKNKRDIIKEYLRRTNGALKIEEQDINED